MKNWIVIAILALTGFAVLGDWVSLPSSPDGVTPQSGMDNAIKAIAAIAGAIVALTGAAQGLDEDGAPTGSRVASPNQYRVLDRPRRT